MIWSLGRVYISCSLGARLGSRAPAEFEAAKVLTGWVVAAISSTTALTIGAASDDPSVSISSTTGAALATAVTSTTKLSLIVPNHIN
ncbi:hypothetical protein COP2_035258 [Malus domestica]